MVNIFKVCCNIIVDAKNKYMNTYLLKIKGMISPVKIWRYGEKNKENIIYFITDISTQRSGTFSIYLGVLDELAYAEKMNWISVVDSMQGVCRKQKRDKMKNFMNNTFQFENILPIEEVFQSQNVIFSTILNKVKLMQLFHETDVPDKRKLNSIFDFEEEELQYWRDLARRRIKFSDTVSEQLNEAYRQVIPDGGKVLSVAVREGKMFLTEQTRKQSGEHVQPSIEEFIATVTKYCSEWKCQYIYLSCEARETIDIFNKAFGEDKVLVLERYRFRLDDLKSITTFKTGKRLWRSMAKIENYDMDYVKDMYILSKGDCLICPVNCGTEAAYIMSEGFEHHYVIRKD